MHLKERSRRHSILRLLSLPALTLVLATLSIAQGAKVTQLYSFGGSSGANPLYASLVQGPDGLLYGTTVYGGDHNMGVVFKIDTSGNLTTLHSFNGSDGSYPWGGLTLGSDGYFYGATPTGGAGTFGEIFKIDSAGAFTVLHSFLYYPTGGGGPYSPPILATDGTFYGVTDFGGPQNAGTLYRITSGGQFNVLYSYSNADGAGLMFVPVQGLNGNFYVTALIGGGNGCGSITEVSLRGVLLNQFSFDCQSQGKYSVGGLALGPDGYLYGTTDQGATGNGGVLFKVDADLGYTVLQDFGAIQGGGIDPEAGLVLATDHKLYGLTISGGSRNLGTIYRVSADGTLDNLVSWTIKVQAQAAMTQHTNGTLYGVTYEGGNYGLGIVYSLNLGLGPFVKFAGTAAKVGQTAQILGQGLTGTTAVTFNGVPAASFSVVSDTYLNAVVPSGATTGPVVVTTPGGLLTSNVHFRVRQ